MSDEPFEIELADRERELLRRAMGQWIGPSRPTDEIAIAMGYQSVVALVDDSKRLTQALKNGDSLSSLDWARTLISLEINFASHSWGCGEHWQSVSGFTDEETVALLRPIQRKMRKLIRTPGTRPERPLQRP